MKRNVIRAMMLILLLTSPACLTGCKAQTPAGKYIQELVSEDPEIRSNADLSLTVMGPPAVEPLINALNGDNDEIRIEAAKILGQIGDTNAIEAIKEMGFPAIEPLITAVNDENEPHRQHIILTLSKLENEEATQAIISVATDTIHYDISAYAQSTLVEMGASAVEPLIRALRDDNKFVRYCAMEVIPKIGMPAYEAIVHMGSEGTALMVFVIEDDAARSNLSNRIDWPEHVLSLIGVPAVDSLIALLKNESDQVRGSVVYALGEINDERAIEPLIQVLKDEESWVRSCTVQTLGKFDDTRIIEPLISVFNDQDWEVYGSAKEILTRIGIPAVEALLTASIGEDRQTCSVAEDCLASMGEPIVSILISHLNDEIPQKRWEASAILGKMNSLQLDIFSDAIFESKLDVIANAYLYYIVKGFEDSEPLLIKALNAYGNVEMAEDFLNCGNANLNEAAVKWANKHGYQIVGDTTNSYYHAWDES